MRRQAPLLHPNILIYSSFCRIMLLAQILQYLPAMRQIPDINKEVIIITQQGEYKYPNTDFVQVIIRPKISSTKGGHNVQSS